jgi:hypothetical protein
VVAHFSSWNSGVLPWGDTELFLFLTQLWTVEILLFHGYLNRDARAAIKAFQPYLTAEGEEIQRMVYEFTHLPARTVAIMTWLGAVLGIYLSYLTELSMRGALQFSVGTILGFNNYAFQVSLAFILCYRIVRQLRMVSRLYAAASQIDLFHLEPVYALSAHSARTGLIFLLILYSNLLIFPETLEFGPAFIFAVAALTVFAIAGFYLPLRGINRRLVEEKIARLAEIHGRIRSAFTHLDHNFDAGNYGEIAEVHSTFAALQSQKAFIEAIPTWPWQPATLRGFLSAVLLPVGIWIIQQILDRFVSF